MHPPIDKDIVRAMRKDYMLASSAGAADETARVAAYWTEVWRKAGGPKATTSRVPRQEEYRKMLPYLLQLPTGAQLLDGGCGLGEWAKHLTDIGYRTVGIDISSATIEQLKTVFPDITFQVADIRATGFPDSYFDGYFSWGTFEHFEDGLDACVAEAFRVLKPGGYLFISTPFDNLRHALAAALDANRSEKPHAEKARFYQWRLTRGEMRNYLANNGFEVLDLAPIAKRQGIVRMLWQWFGLHYDTRLAKVLGRVMAPFAWSEFAAHMLMGIARKPQK